MNKIKFLLGLLVCFLAPAMLFAQGADAQVADALRKDGKIYVVFVCAFLLLISIISYMIALDRKLRKLEKMNLEENRHA
jgi:hypothetical protein